MTPPPPTEPPQIELPPIDQFRLDLSGTAGLGDIDSTAAEIGERIKAVTAG